jgi:hypothetical protein
LREHVSIRDLRTIFEVLTEAGLQTKDPNVLTEFVRSALGRSITKKLLTNDGDLPLITLDRVVEEKIAQGLIQTDQGMQLSLDPNFVQQLVRELNSEAEKNGFGKFTGCGSGEPDDSHTSSTISRKIYSPFSGAFAQRNFFKYSSKIILYGEVS